MREPPDTWMETQNKTNNSQCHNAVVFCNHPKMQPFMEITDLPVKVTESDGWIDIILAGMIYANARQMPLRKINQA